MSGLVGWGKVTQTPLGHPRIDIPESKLGPDGKEITNITVSPENDGTTAWIGYTATRLTWKDEKFAKTYPRETVYRHSLAEEADALRSVIKMATQLKPKTMNPQISMLSKLDQDGVLEAFVLIAMPDAGIARDHPAYLRANRDKLRQYVLKYVIAPK
jgi:hypothetical protein